MPNFVRRKIWHCECKVVNFQKDTPMKWLFKIVFVVAALLSAVGCDSSTISGTKKTAQGAPYEVLVVCNGPEWESELGKELRKVLQKPVEMLNQVEPMFDVVRITQRDFKHLLPSYRNIIKVICSPSVSQTAILAKYDEVASPQIVLTLQGPTIEAMVEYLEKNGESLRQVLEMAERERTISIAKKRGAKEVERLISEKFGVNIPLSSGYLFRAESEDFLWISNEYPAASQGLFIYTHPFTGASSVTTKALVAARNNFAKRIPGPSKGSYMTTVKRIPNLEDNGYVDFTPSRKTLNINGRDWVELRGFWDVEGDFMGGPFVSYTTLDENSGKLLTIDCYVYSPKEDKRNFLRPLEHIVYGVTFPEKTEK